MTDDQNEDGPRALPVAPWSDENRSRVPAPTLTPEIASEIVAALKAGHGIVCLTQCYPYQFSECAAVSAPHTWMANEDIVHAGLAIPTTPSGWAYLAKSRPCGCACNRSPK